VVVLWLGLTMVMLVNRGVYDLRHRSVRLARRELSGQGVHGSSGPERAKYVQRILARLPRRTVERIAADSNAPAWLAEAFADFGMTRWGVERLVRHASAHRSERGRWRRVAALRILAQAAHPEVLALLHRAVQDHDPMVAGAGVALLGRRREPAAAGLLVDALRTGRHSRSRIATALDQSPALSPAVLVPLLEDESGPVRFWAATLLARFAGEGLDRRLAPMSEDPDANVRKAAVETLGVIGGPDAAAVAERLLADSTWFVKAHAARALGQLGCADLAPRIVALLADPEWWVRLAAKEALESLGEAAWPALREALGHPDRFARNGAAEVLQNAGAFDALLLRGRAADSTPEDVAILRQLAAAGGSGMVVGLVERLPAGAGPDEQERLRQLLRAAGVEPVAA
jgi:HEAT repeat protein